MISSRKGLSRAANIAAVLMLALFMGVSSVHANDLTAEQVADIDPGASSGLSGVYPSDDFTPFNGELYFFADTLETGQELWKTDGTAAGTTLVRDINPGPDDSAFFSGPNLKALFEFNGELYFMADDGTHGLELWKTDGTEAGTTLVIDLYPGPEDGGTYRGMAVYNNELYFTGNDGVVGEELWKTDGTAAGTTLVQDIWDDTNVISGPTQYRVFNGLLFFFATSPDTGFELWRTDGTEVGTFALDVLPGGNNGVNYGVSLEQKGYLAVLNGELYFAARDALGPHDLWKTDGTLAGTVLAVELTEDGFTPEDLTAFDGALYFTFGETATGRELWRSDGTPAGTFLVADIAPGDDSGLFISLQGGPILTEFNGELYFVANDVVRGEELWKTDGTEAGTTIVRDIAAGTASGLESIRNTTVPTVFNGELYFTARTDATGQELWKTDGTEAGTVLVEDFNPGSSSGALELAGMREYEGDLYFAANDGVTGVELWRLTDTPTNTAQNLLGDSFLDDLNDAGTDPADYFDDVFGSPPVLFPVPPAFLTPETDNTALLFSPGPENLEGVRETVPLTNTQTGGSVTMSFLYATNLDSGVLGGQLLLRDSTTGEVVEAQTNAIALPGGSANLADGAAPFEMTLDVPDGTSFDEVTFGIGHVGAEGGFLGITGIRLVADPTGTGSDDPGGDPEVGQCLSPEEAELASLVNGYRQDNGLPAVPVSVSLTTVAQYHVLDLHTYRPDEGTDDRGLECNLHSWSENGPWSPVCYTSDHYYAAGMWDKPDEITNGTYNFTGYENAYYTSLGATAQGALDAWANSPGHNAVILELDVWQGKNWPAMGVGIHEEFAVLWFGDGTDPQGTIEQCQ